MGTVRVNLAVGDPKGERYESVAALVDTKATYTTLPASILRGLGVIPHDWAEFELADGWGVWGFRGGWSRVILSVAKNLPPL